MTHPVFRALRVTEQPGGTFTRQITWLPADQLPQGEVLVRVQYSSLNYKDALSASGNKGITRHYPHTPGIDAAGLVEESTDPEFNPGDPVIVTSYDLGMNTDGGFAEFIRVPSAWVLPLPSGMDLRESMMLGTAGFTAALALYKMEKCGQHPGMGPLVVSGATGGVGSLAVVLLAQAGYEVIAATGKEDAHAYLRELGAQHVIGRGEVDDISGRPLLRSQWAGGIDTVGGNTLATILKATRREGSVAACGLVSSNQLTTSVFPFILNGVNLLGIDSATCPMPLRQQIWELLANEWRLYHLEEICHFYPLEEIEGQIEAMLKGQVRGRVVVEIA